MLWYASFMGTSCSLPFPITPRCPRTLSPLAPHARILHTLPTGTALAVAAVGLVLLSAGSWFAIRKAEGEGEGGGKVEDVGVLLRAWCSGRGVRGNLGVNSWGRRCLGVMAVGSQAGEAAEGAGELQPSSPSPEMGARTGQPVCVR